MALVRGQFNSLLTPGLVNALKQEVLAELGCQIEHEEEMALLHPDTSQVPVWRRPPTRMEHPIHAWRCWMIERVGSSWRLASVAANCVWEGPVIRAHKRPVDPKYWDAKKKPDPVVAKDRSGYTAQYQEYYGEMHDTFSLAGIHALKTKELVLETVRLYRANCYGQVDLWGRVAQFELGYRAEACMVKSIHIVNMSEMPTTYLRDIMLDFSRCYECEVTVDA